ncbi:coiled-coil domain-containing protein 177 [Callorhinchus milii]|nr:coiled-coil domain-containing protein 177 [Callorhinchus milii]
MWKKQTEALEETGHLVEMLKGNEDEEQDPRTSAEVCEIGVNIGGSLEISIIKDMETTGLNCGGSVALDTGQTDALLADDLFQGTAADSAVNIGIIAVLSAALALEYLDPGSIPAHQQDFEGQISQWGRESSLPLSVIQPGRGWAEAELGYVELPQAARVPQSGPRLRLQLVHRALHQLACERPRAPLLNLSRQQEEEEEEARHRRELRECRGERQRIIEVEKARRTPIPAFLKFAAHRSVDESIFPNSDILDALHGIRSSPRPALSECRNRSPSWAISSEDSQKTSPQKKRKDTGLKVHFRKSTSLGDLRQSPATARKLDKLVNEIRRETNVIIPERDRKIAALMLVKHQEEQKRLEQRIQAQQFWDSLKRKEKLEQMRKEAERQRELIESIGRWKREHENRRCKIHQKIKQMAELKAKDVILKENKWRRLAEEQDLKRKEKVEEAKYQAEIRKCHQNQLLQQTEDVKRTIKQLEVQISQDKLSNAAQKRLFKEMREQNRIKLENEQEKLKHTILKREVDNLAKTEELMARMSLERKLLKFKENQEQLVEERSRELKEKAAREEQQILQARIRAEKLEQEEKERKEALAKLSEYKVQQAKKALLIHIRQKALRTQKIRSEKEKAHHLIKKRVEEEKEWQRREMEETIKRKDKRSEEILKVKEETIEESRRVARAAFQMRERVRKQINRRSFDQMAMEPQMWAGLANKIAH